MNINKMYIYCFLSISLLVGLNFNAYAFENKTKEIVRNVKTIQCPELPVSENGVKTIAAPKDTFIFNDPWKVSYPPYSYDTKVIRRAGEPYTPGKPDVIENKPWGDKLICNGILVTTDRGKPVKVNVKMEGELSHSWRDYTCESSGDGFSCSSK